MECIYVNPAIIQTFYDICNTIPWHITTEIIRNEAWLF